MASRRVCVDFTLPTSIMISLLFWAGIGCLGDQSCQNLDRHRSLLVFPTFPRLGLPEWEGRESSDCVARCSFSSRTDFSPLPSDVARRLRRASTTARV